MSHHIGSNKKYNKIISLKKITYYSKKILNINVNYLIRILTKFKREDRKQKEYILKYTFLKFEKLLTN